MSPVTKQPFVVVSGMVTLSGDLPPTSSSACNKSVRPDEEDGLGAIASGELSAEAAAKTEDTATKSPEFASPVSTHVVELAQVPGQVLHVGVAGSRMSLSEGESAARVAGSRSPPRREVGAPEPLPGDDLPAVDVETKARNVVPKAAPDKPSRRDKSTGGGVLSPKEPEGEAKREANTAKNPVRLIVVSSLRYCCSHFLCWTLYSRCLPRRRSASFPRK